MKKGLKKLIAVASAISVLGGMTTTLAACKHEEEYDVSQDVVTRTNTASVYDKIGSGVTIDQVTENDDGIAFVTVNGTKYELGMDFLSMAMVYNCTVPENSEKYKTAEDVYNEWWKLYIQRWNILVPEVPLYSNQYFDVFNAEKLNKDTFKTSPYYGVADAIVGASMNSGHENDTYILGNTTDLSGSFRVASFGKANPGAGDLDIQNLTSGYSTVYADFDGLLTWADDNILLSHEEELDEDEGTLTYTLEVAHDLTLADGTPITAKNYVVSTVVGSTPIYLEASDAATAGMSLVGYDEFNVYDGTNDGDDVDGVTASKVFTGVKLYSDNAYKFSVTLTPDYAGYYYSIYNALFTPVDHRLYGLSADGTELKVDANGNVYLDDSYYATETKAGITSFSKASTIVNNMNTPVSNNISYVGPFVVKSYDSTSKTAELEKNDKYKGDYRSNNAPTTIKKLSYIKLVSETQSDKFTAGEVDVLAGVTGGDDTKAALKIVSDNPTKFAEVHYDRAGYGKLAFRCDLGATMFKEVRQAVMYTINRTSFAQTFTGGYGGVVDGPYYAQSSQYKAVADTIKINKYAYSVDKAKEVLEAGGWVYNADGSAYSGSGIRYKKLEGYEKDEYTLRFSSVDNKYKTERVNGEYYLPLVINWSATDPNPFSDQLETTWANSNAVKEIGMYVTVSRGDFYPVLYGDYNQLPAYGFKAPAKCNAANFATGFTSSIYDYAFNWSVNPAFKPYSANFVFDEADYWTTYHAE